MEKKTKILGGRNANKILMESLTLYFWDLFAMLFLMKGGKNGCHNGNKERREKKRKEKDEIL